MNCENVSRGLIAYLDRRASSADRQEIEQHLMLCVDCRSRAEQFRALWGVMDEMPAIEPSYAFDSRVRERVAAEPARGWLGWLVPQPRLAISAALLAVLAVWTVKTSPVNKPVAPTAASVQQEDFDAIKNLDVLENYDVVTSMDALSELAPTGTLDNGIQNQRASSTTAE
ncbi:MAG TPA: zf-HC2 domain-containing protein [Candidatus Acidoferrales bacterium]